MAYDMGGMIECEIRRSPLGRISFEYEWNIAVSVPSLAPKYEMVILLNFYLLLPIKIAQMLSQTVESLVRASNMQSNP